jgi:hypothetical protein
VRPGLGQDWRGEERNIQQKGKTMTEGPEESGAPAVERRTGIAVSRHGPATPPRPGLVPGPKGGWLRPPVAKGEVRNPSGYAGTMREVQRMCREKSPEAVGTLFELLHSHDERVRLIAAQKILEWGYGSPSLYDPKEEERHLVFDLSKLSSEELAVLGKLVRTGAVKLGNN